MEISTTVLNVERLDQNYEIIVEIGSTLTAAGLSPVITVLEGGTTNSYKATSDVLLARKYMTVEVSMSTQGNDGAPVTPGTYDLELILQITTPVYAEDEVTLVNTYVYNVSRPISLQISAASVVANSAFEVWDTPVLDGGARRGQVLLEGQRRPVRIDAVDTSSIKVDVINPNGEYVDDTTDSGRRRLSAYAQVEKKIECTAYDCTTRRCPPMESQAGGQWRASVPSA